MGSTARHGKQREAFVCHHPPAGPSLGATRSDGTSLFQHWRSCVLRLPSGPPIPLQCRRQGEARRSGPDSGSNEPAWPRARPGPVLPARARPDMPGPRKPGAQTFGLPSQGLSLPGATQPPGWPAACTGTRSSIVHNRQQRARVGAAVARRRDDKDQSGCEGPAPVHAGIVAVCCRNNTRAPAPHATPAVSVRVRVRVCASPPLPPPSPRTWREHRGCRPGHLHGARDSNGRT